MCVCVCVVEGGRGLQRKGNDKEESVGKEYVSRNNWAKNWRSMHYLTSHNKGHNYYILDCIHVHACTCTSDPLMNRLPIYIQARV